jgi:bromodomain adjacent to zinc finger domain protein 1A
VPFSRPPPPRYFARIVKAIPPQAAASPFAKVTEHPPLHQISGDLKVPAKDVNATDDPAQYSYHIHIIDEERSSDHKLSVKDRETREANRAKWSESLMEVQCGSLRSVPCPPRPVVRSW